VAKAGSHTDKKMAVNLQLKIDSAPSGLDGPLDLELIARVRKGDAAAFEKLMRRYNQRLFRAARSVLRNESEAEDVVQETFVRAYRGLADFKEQSSLGTWLTQIAVHEALARVRRSRRFGSLEGESDDHETGVSQVESSRAGPEQETSSRELRSMLIAAIDSLPEDLRIVFVLREVDGLSTIETSEILQISTEAVRVRLHRARVALRARIEKALGEEVRAVFEFAGARCDRTVAQVFQKLGLTLPPCSPKASLSWLPWIKAYLPWS
jgi:RNA polymerase sigma-70 factor (ECF subfamily)